MVVQVSGSKFYYLKNEAVLLEMALINWTITEVMRRGFTPLITPEIVRSSVVEKCGFQPRGENTQVCRYVAESNNWIFLCTHVALVTTNNWCDHNQIITCHLNHSHHELCNSLSQSQLYPVLGFKLLRNS